MAQLEAMGVEEIIIIDDEETYKSASSTLPKFQLTSLSPPFVQYRTLLAQEPPDFNKAFKEVWEAFEKKVKPLVVNEKVVCVMCADPDNLGAALIAKFLMSHSTLQISLAKALDIVKQRRIQTDVLRQITEAMVYEEVKKAVAEMISGKPKPAEKTTPKPQVAATKTKKEEIADLFTQLA